MKKFSHFEELENTTAADRQLFPILSKIATSYYFSVYA